MKTYRFYFDKDQHEAYLNQMSRQGWALVSCAYGLHTFVPCEKGQFVYRFDLIDPNAYESEKEAYVGFVEDTGAVLVAEMNQWYVFRKDAAAGPFELYTDLPSKIRYYERIRTMYAGLALTAVIVGLNPLLSYFRTDYGPFLITATLLGSIAIRPALAVRHLSHKISGLKARQLH